MPEEDGEPLAGKVACVTGSGSGLGQATVQLLAERGARVVVTELPERLAQARAVAADVGPAGRALALPLDVRDPASIGAAVQRTVETFGGLDVMVCNAGVNVRKAALDVTPEDWDAVLDVNLRGVFFSAQAAGAQMVRQGRGGKIVLIASIMGLVASQYSGAAYCASKAGVVNLARELALEWAPHNIQVNAVAPTYTLTPLTASVLAQGEFREFVLARQPNGQLATPRSIAEAVGFLASAQADMITGVCLPVDGGWTAQ
jgi:2-dehydro-3-deoxy-D-gluconate 5-dehydrogenase